MSHTPTTTKSVTIFTDGGCEGNPGPGGWAAVLMSGPHRKEISGGAPATTNNRMELTAAIEALAALKERCQVELLTDSQYVRDGIDRWLVGWKRNGWRTRDKQPVKNADLWQRLDTLAQRQPVVWRWVKGHAGHEHNERCDELAREQMALIRRSHSHAQLREMLADFRAGRGVSSLANQGATLL